MRLLERNKKELWYANPTGWSYAEDSNGLKTGEKTITYGTPTKVRMTVSVSSGANNLGSQGMAELQPYGIQTGYTHRAVTEDKSCLMNEESHVWYGINPTRTVTVNGQDTEEAVPHNFVVVRKSPSMSNIIYYLKEVEVQYPVVPPTPTPTPTPDPEPVEPDEPDDPGEQEVNEP